MPDSELPQAALPCNCRASGCLEPKSTAPLAGGASLAAAVLVRLCLSLCRGGGCLELKATKHTHWEQVAASTDSLPPDLLARFKVGRAGLDAAQGLDAAAH